MVKKEAIEVNEYELQRQANIKERDALLKNLALEAAGAGLGPKQPVKRASATSGNKRKAPAPKIKQEALEPRRKSSRLAGIEADSAVAKRKAEQQFEVEKERFWAKRQRVSGDLDLKDILVAGSEGALNDFVVRGAAPYERTFGDEEVKKTSDKELKALRERMNGLELYDGFQPNRGYLRSSHSSVLTDGRDRD